MSQVSSVFSKKKTVRMGKQKSQSFKEKKMSAMKQKAEVVLSEASENNDQNEDREPLVTLNEVEEESSLSGSSKG